MAQLAQALEALSVQGCSAAYIVALVLHKAQGLAQVLALVLEAADAMANILVLGEVQRLEQARYIEVEERLHFALQP